MSHKQAKRVRQEGRHKTPVEPDVSLSDRIGMLDMLRFALREFPLQYDKAIVACEKRIARHLGKNSKTYASNGSKECARRVKQIDDGTIMRYHHA